ncbi:glycoside hydrolase superfamily [Biscogniauxia mediterranea]|nr:glycoside hydrolase superfamily [Biscogniauxia mediterranea]
MKFFNIVIGALALLDVSAGAPSGNVQRANSNSWMGSNLYFLQGLSSSDQDQWIDNIVSYGAKVVRVWVNGQGGKGHCEKGSKLDLGVPQLEESGTGGLGHYNDETLDALDVVLNKLANKGLKAIISPHDANALDPNGGKCDVYCSKWGSGSFYEDSAATDQYDARLSYILNYKGKTSGKQWKTWSDAILAFDIQNEPFNAKVAECTNSEAKDWVCGRAKHMRSELGSSSPILIASGGIGGDYSHDCNFAAYATGCAELDLLSVHRYAGPQGSGTQWSSIDWAKAAGGKKVYVEEWGVFSNKVAPKTDYPAQAGDINKIGLPGVYWQILPPKNADCPYDPSQDGDPFGIFMDSGVDIAGPMQEAAKTPGLQDWAGSVY